MVWKPDKISCQVDAIGNRDLFCNYSHYINNQENPSPLLELKRVDDQLLKKFTQKIRRLSLIANKK